MPLSLAGAVFRFQAILALGCGAMVEAAECQRELWRQSALRSSTFEKTAIPTAEAGSFSALR